MDKDLKELLEALKNLMEGHNTDEFNWSLNIERVDNGFICRYSEDTDIGEVANRTELIENADDDLCNDESLQNAKTAERLCYKILDYFCLDGNKHDEYRIRIKIEHQNPPEGEKLHDEEED